MSGPKKSCGCSCDSEITVIFPCSGSADVGELSDRLARKLTKKGRGQMSCLAGIGGNVSGMVQAAKSADKILVIDGCPVNCAKKTLEQKKIKKLTHFVVTDNGFTKGKSKVSAGSINTLLKRCLEVL
ncbi:MAG: putative zinc-binding protein [Oligoflexia bacterium]|nr:putative zinc-binding protein [Oligoflexia bacterium]